MFNIYTTASLLKVLKYCLITVTTLSLSGLAAASSKKIPLEFHPRHGTYSANLNFGANAEGMLLVVDTGSSNLNVIGDKSMCPKCNVHIKSSRFSSNPQIIDLGKSFKMAYGIGRGKLKLYQTPVEIAPDLRLDKFRIGVFHQGKHLVNILGMAFPRLAQPRKEKMTTLFSALNKKYKFGGTFSLLLCRDKGQSHMTFGKPDNSKLAKKKYHVPLAWRGFFSLFHYGVSNQKDNRLMVLEPGTTAILDSGTTGKLVYPEAHLKKLRTYLFAANTDENRALPRRFWKGEQCVFKDEIDIKAFPTLYMHFLDTEGELLRLPFTPEHYITSVGCFEDRVRLAFISSEYVFRNKKNTKSKKRLMKKIILGTPLLEQYHVQFKMAEPRGFVFSESKDLCKNISPNADTEDLDLDE